VDSNNWLKPRRRLSRIVKICGLLQEASVGGRLFADRQVTGKERKSNATWRKSSLRYSELLNETLAY